jgi:hypothetical protein
MNLIDNRSVVFCADEVGDAVEDREEVEGLVVAFFEDDTDDRAEVDKNVEDWGVVVAEGGRNGITMAGGFEATEGLDAGVGKAAEE